LFGGGGGGVLLGLCGCGGGCWVLVGVWGGGCVGGGGWKHQLKGV